MTLYSGILARLETLGEHPDTAVLDDIDRTLEEVFSAQPANGGPVRAYTRSLDAALCLCERVLPGWRWQVRKFYDVYDTLLWRPEGVACHARAVAPTPSLALLAAMLKALGAEAASPESQGVSQDVK